MKELQILHKQYPEIHHYLNFTNPLELFVATILSAQVRDETVNKTTTKLFEKYKTAKDYAKADEQELINDIKSVSFPANKAKNIIAACKILDEKYGGSIPKKIEELTSLPGIGRKSANAILQNAYGIVEGIVVDTHVLRIAYRLGWTNTEKNAEKSEEQLMKKIPKNEWKTLPWLLKNHGRKTCKAPKPICSKCPLDKLCPKQGVTNAL